jgi:hypothetical protein
MDRPARLVVFGFAALTVFQLALAAGAPLGHAAWGGREASLSAAERIGSGASVIFYLVAIGVVHNRASGRTERRYRWGAWALAVLMALSALMNAASGSGWEKLVLAPVASVLAILCAAVARAPTVARERPLTSTGRSPRRRRGRDTPGFRRPAR